MHASQYGLLGPCLSQEANFRGFGGKNLAENEEITTLPVLLLVVKQLEGKLLLLMVLVSVKC